MIELSLKNKKGKVNVKSSEVKNILESRPDFEYVQDISATINQERIMVYDCQLSRDIFNLDDIEEIQEEMGQNIDDSYFDVLFEDIRAYLKDAPDNCLLPINLDKFVRDAILISLKLIRNTNLKSVNVSSILYISK